jgi:hypothetical protein
MNIQWSQVLLVLFILAFIIYVVRLRNVLTDRIIFLVSALIGIAFVIRPNLATYLANLIGIGRGADLLLYLMIIFSLFFSVTVLAEIKKVDAKLTDVVRKIALMNPVEGKSGDKKDGEIMPPSDVER